MNMPGGDAGAGATTLAAILAGLALGVTLQAGGALLLFAGAGFLASFGAILALALLAIAAGVWVGRGRPGERIPTVRARWLAAVVVYTAAAVYAQFWMGFNFDDNGMLRGGAVLLMLAAPGYAVGWLLAGLENRAVPGDTGLAAVPVVAAALAGTAGGVYLAALLLIPRVEPGIIYLAAAMALAVGGLIETTVSAGAGGRRDMRDKVVLITGVGGRGQVGYRIAERFLELGARVVITDVQAEVETLAQDLARRGEVVGFAADLTRAEEVSRLVARTEERFGGLDVLVNAVGGLTVIRPLAETTDEEWARELDRNARTVFLVCRAALPLLRRSGGSIVNFAAPAGERAMARLGAYSAAKAAVIAVTRALAIEEKDAGVRANAIAPGMIDTEQNRREVEDPEQVAWVSRDQIADAVLYLAGDAASGVTGETLHVPGKGLS